MARLAQQGEVCGGDQHQQGVDDDEADDDDEQDADDGFDGFRERDDGDDGSCGPPDQAGDDEIDDDGDQRCDHGKGTAGAGIGSMSDDAALKSLVSAAAPYLLPGLIAALIALLGTIGTLILNDIKGSVNDIKVEVESVGKVEKADVEDQKRQLEAQRVALEQTREMVLDLKGQLGALRTFVTLLHRDPTLAGSLPPAD